MKITVIGWYGTETIGDRAILAGLFSFFKKTYGDCEIQIGSLYPFYSERMLNEDFSFWKQIVGDNLKVSQFNSKRSKELNNAIKNSDLLVMGGGPLMHIDEIFMVDYAFRKAKKLKVKTALLGCGVGPLFPKKSKKAVLKIAQNSDLVILRDSKSKDNLLKINSEFKGKLKEKDIFTSLDPAVECAMLFQTFNKTKREGYIAINLREFPIDYSKQEQSKRINDNLFKYVKDISNQYPNEKIRLIPMHYFHVGNDDRLFLNDIKLELSNTNVEVQNSILTLEETMQVFANAKLCIGMRFHSVVLQTIVNGNNYILDYTEPKIGKISGFIGDIDESDFFDTRYTSLQDDDISIDNIDINSSSFQVSNEVLSNYMNIYVDKLKALIL
jgi:polysaccharide pyruvyl transferase WcaK-like protein